MAVPIREGVPLPSTRQKTDWLPLLKRLVKPGQSAELPMAARHTLGQAITAAHKQQLGTFTTRIDKTAQTVSVWRTA